MPPNTPTPLPTPPITPPPYNGGKPRSNTALIVIIIVAVTAVVAATVAIILIVLAANQTDSTIDSPAKEQTSSTDKTQDTQPESYTSETHKFNINFPGEPEVNNSTLDVDGTSVPYTQYMREEGRGSSAYLVQIADYPSSFDFTGVEREALDGAIDGMAKTSDATIISRTNTGTFLGSPSSDAVFTITAAGEEYTAYARNFLKGNRLYTIMTLGVAEADYQKFLISFTHL